MIRTAEVISRMFDHFTFSNRWLYVQSCTCKCTYDFGRFISSERRDPQRHFQLHLIPVPCAHGAMSALNSPRGQGCVVNIDDIAVASSVIKALRSSSNSNRHYKQNAARDDHLVNDVNQFNRIINDRRDEVLKSNLIEQQMNEALNSYIPPTRSMVIVQSPDERQVK